ncbi:MAG: hypothetical protein JNL08_18465 [Planctomycetes bacterium]|nr:hypothetical protein [Planctomycetota bacterium]
MRRTFLPIAFAASAASLASQTWQEITPTTFPSTRRGAAMAFDSTANRLLLYGGAQPTPAVILSETWAYNGTWTKLNPATSLPRWGHQMVRNTATNRVVAFGGRSPTIAALANDTIEWTGTNWVAVPTPTAPQARYRHGLAFDSQRNVMVLFGGRGVSQVLDDTWEFDGVTWTQRAPATQPPPREDFVMAYDASMGVTIVFGGFDPDTNSLLGDTWEWDGNTWTERTPVTSPTARYRAAAAFDTTRQRLVMYGGFDGTDISTETWEYASGAWNVVASGANTGTQDATEVHAGYDPQRRKFVNYGGVGAVFNDETWEFTGATTGVLGTFGTGCPTSTGIAVPSAAVPPAINTTYTIEWSNLPATTPAVISVHGVSRVSYAGIPLPLDLAIIGLPGCDLLVSADLVGIETATGGVVNTSLVLPNVTAFVNTSIYSQILIPDALAPNANGGASIGARSLIGN